MQTYAVIPARGGSTRLPGKNLAPCAGKPLIAWTIEAALVSACFDQVLVSTDDEAIASVARTCDACVPWLRPPSLATATASSLDVVQHAIDQQDWTEGTVMLLPPTAPLRTGEDIREALALMRSAMAWTLVSVTPVTHHPYWTQRRDARGWVHSFWPEAPPPAERSQDLPPCYGLNGAIYAATIPVFKALHHFHSPRTQGYVMPPERSIDIDTHWDLYLADMLLRGRAGAYRYVSSTTAIPCTS